MQSKMAPTFMGMTNSSDGQSSGYFAKLQQRERKANHLDKLKGSSPTNNNTQSHPTTSRDANANNMASGSDRQAVMQARRVANSMYVVSDKNTNWLAAQDLEVHSTASSSPQQPVEDKVSNKNNNYSIVDSSVDDRDLVMVSHQVAHILERSHKNRPDIGSSTSNDLFQMLDTPNHNPPAALDDSFHDSSTSQGRFWLLENRQEANKQNVQSRRKQKNLVIVTDTTTPSTRTSSSSSASSPLPPMDDWEAEEEEDDDIPTMGRMDASTHDPQLFMQARREANNMIRTDALSTTPKALPSTSVATTSTGVNNPKQSVVNHITTSPPGESESQVDRTWVMESRQEVNHIRQASAKSLITLTAHPPVLRAAQAPTETMNEHARAPPPPPPLPTSMQSSSKVLMDQTAHPTASTSPKKSSRRLLQSKGPNPSTENDVAAATDQFLAHMIQASMPEDKDYKPESNNRSVVKHSKDSSRNPTMRHDIHPTKSPMITTLTSDQLFLHLDASPPSHKNDLPSNGNAMISSSKNHRNSHEKKHNLVQNRNKSPSDALIQNQSASKFLQQSSSPKQIFENSSPTLSNSLKSIVAAFSCADVSEDMQQGEDTGQAFLPSHATNPTTRALVAMNDGKGVIIQGDANTFTATSKPKPVSHDLLNFCDPLCNSHQTPMNYHQMNGVSNRTNPKNLPQPNSEQSLSRRSESLDEASVFTFITKSSEGPNLSAYLPPSEGEAPSEGEIHTILAEMKKKDAIDTSVSQPSKQNWNSNSSITSASTSSYRLAKEMNQRNLLDESSAHPRPILKSSQVTNVPSQRSILKEQATLIDWELEWIKSQLQLKHMLATTVVEWFRSEAELTILMKQMDEMQKKELQYKQEIQKLLESPYEGGDMSDVLSATHSSASDNGRKEELQRENFKLKATIRKMKADAQKEAMKRKEPTIDEDSTESSSNQIHVSEKLTLRADLVELKSQISDLKEKNVELRSELDKEKMLHEKVQRQLDSEKKNEEKTEAMQKEIHSLQFVLKIKSDSLSECKAQIASLERDMRDINFDMRDITQENKIEVEMYQKQILELKELLDLGAKDSDASTKSDDDETSRDKIALLEQELASEREKSDQIPKVGGRVEARILAYKKKYEQTFAKYEQSLLNEKALKEKIDLLENELKTKNIVDKAVNGDRVGMTIHHIPSDLVTEKASNLHTKSSFSDDETDEKIALIHELELEIESLQTQLSAAVTECQSLKNLVEQYQVRDKDTNTGMYSFESLRKQLDEARGKMESYASIETSLRSFISSLESQLVEQRKEVADSKRRSEELTKALDETDVLLNEVSLTAEEKQRLENEISKLSSELIDARAKARRLSIKAEVDLSKMREVETQLRQEILALREQVDTLTCEKDEQERLALSNDGIAEQLRKRDEKLGQYENSIQTLIEEMQTLSSKHQDQILNLMSSTDMELHQLRQSKSELLQTLQVTQSYAEQLKTDYDTLLQKYEADLDEYKDTEESLRLQLSRIRKKHLSMGSERALENRTRVQDDLTLGDEVEIEMLDTNEDADIDDPESDVEDRISHKNNVQKETVLLTQIESLRSSLKEAQKQSENWKQLYDQYIKNSISSAQQSSNNLTFTEPAMASIHELPQSRTKVPPLNTTAVKNSRPSTPLIMDIGTYDDSPVVRMHDYGLSHLSDDVKNELGLHALD